nr:uncharacterized protein LOC120366625 [Saimiri boliviensis boliviensis]
MQDFISNLFQLPKSPKMKDPRLLPSAQAIKLAPAAKNQSAAWLRPGTRLRCAGLTICYTAARQSVLQAGSRLESPGVFSSPARCLPSFSVTAAAAALKAAQSLREGRQELKGGAEFGAQCGDPAGNMAAAEAEAAAAAVGARGGDGPRCQRWHWFPSSVCSCVAPEPSWRNVSISTGEVLRESYTKGSKVLVSVPLIF